MICSSKEINLLCTACNGLLTKISFCTKCFMPFHPHCLSKTCLKCKPKRISKINLKKLPTPSKNNINFDFFAPFYMSKCCLCKQNSVYFYNNFYCKECFIKICKNNFCSVCKQIFDENDFNSKMVRCDFCIKWIHLKCTELTDYQYGKMSLVGSNDEFCCKSCEKNLRKFKKMRNEPVVDNFFKCTVCKVGYLYDDPILVLYPYGTLFKHLNCTKLSNKCAVCNDTSITSVKCKLCTDSFHTLCSMGLFRQNNLVSMCNAHYHPTNHIKTASKFICSSIQNHKFIPGTFLFSRNVIYKPNEFIRLFFGDYKSKNENFIFPIKIKNELNVKVNFLSFNGDCFSFNGIKISISELKEMGICFESEDVFKVSDKEFRSFVKFIDFLFFKRFCEVIKCDKFFFG